jgi:hypothetical protein
MSTVVLDNANRIFPWLKYLSREQVEEFYVDFFAALEQTLQHKDWSILESVIESWQATADVLADAELTEILAATNPNDDMEDWNDVEANLFNQVTSTRA